MIRPISMLVCAVVLGACGKVESRDVMVTISPESPTTTDDLVASITGGESGLAFRWSVNGGLRPDATTNRISASLTTKHEIWRVEAVDGDMVLDSTEVTIANSPPTLPAVAAPPAPIAAAAIPCTVGGAATDADGDPVQLTISWTLDGAPFPGAIMTTLPNDTVPPQTSHTGNVFVCTVTATDAETPATATATATVAPRIAYAVRQDVTPQVLQTIDLDKGTITDVGPLDVTMAFGDLAWDRIGQKLYMIDGRGAKALYTVNTTTGKTTLIGTHNLTDAFGLGFDPADNNRLYLTTAPGTGNTLYRMNTTTGVPTMIAAVGSTSRMEGLTFDGRRNMFVGITVAGEVYTINVLTGASTLVGTASSMNDFGVTYDPFIDRYWAMDVSSRLISIDPTAAYTSTVTAPNIGQHAAIAIALPPP
jgi:hypothetical protein